MPFRGRTKFGGIVGVALACLSAAAARAEDVKATYESQVGYTLHLLEAGRYGEAADVAQNLITAYPDAALPYELRGTTALYVGNVARAQADFSQAAEKSKDPELVRSWTRVAETWEEMARLTGTMGPEK